MEWGERTTSATPIPAWRNSSINRGVKCNPAVGAAAGGALGRRGADGLLLPAFRISQLQKPVHRVPRREGAERVIGERAIQLEGFARIDGRRVLVLIPDGTRTMPMPLAFDVLESALGPRVATLDFLVALGTHLPLSDAQLGALVGRQVANGRAGSRRIFNHLWDDPATFAILGTIPGREIEELSEGRLHREVPVALNRLVLDYDHILICGPVFPHEVVGFSGGTKYLFPGIAGAEIINDVSALSADPGMPGVARESGAGVILMHMKGMPETMQKNPTYGDLIPEIFDFLEDAIARSVSAGIKRDLIIVDPGIGFGKTFDHNLKIIKELSRFAALERPILLGTSNKAFIGHILGKEAHERDTGTMATVAYGVINGAHIVRVHHVRKAVETVRMIEAIRKGRV